MDLQQAVRKNWTQEAESYNQNIQEELGTERRKVWEELILRHAPKKPVLDILDVGTGPGFFPIVLGNTGHHVTAVDCTEAMIEKARENVERAGAHAQLLVADAGSLPFPNDSFDCVISRNVCWTLAEPKQTYQEWLRILRPGGKILIFDANWNIRYHDEEAMKQYMEDEKIFQEVFQEMAYQLSEEAEKYRRNMPLCKVLRPQWDFSAFLSLGVKSIFCEPDITSFVWDVKRQIKYRSTPMFFLMVEKE